MSCKYLCLYRYITSVEIVFFFLRILKTFPLRSIVLPKHLKNNSIVKASNVRKIKSIRNFWVQANYKNLSWSKYEENKVLTFLSGWLGIEKENSFDSEARSTVLGSWGLSASDPYSRNTVRLALNVVIMMQTVESVLSWVMKITTGRTENRKQLKF